MVQLFNNSFEENFEDMMTAAAILDNCVDKEKREEFFKSVVPNTIMEQKFEKLIELNKSLKAGSEKEEKKEVTILSKSFEEKFAAASADRK